ncbi:MAG: hypothetical protein HFE51_09915 [Clostridia bacterium]|nr:hypothetical protein [Clostridia bacterium]MCI8979383.1 hypothetical protein [Clostridia bacterium]MCI9086718.1 hypothetical protein [Clostridia bacterium]NDO20321.1 hypothetical protein [Lachnospiraceae bacterium MD329]
MSNDDILTLHIKNDCRIQVETEEDGVKLVKYTDADSILKCLKLSVKLSGWIESGILPQNCISYSGDASGNHFVAIVFDAKKADIMFEKTEYINFPLPRLVFGFNIDAAGNIEEIRLGVTEEGRLTPKSKMFVYPFSNVSDFKLCTGSNSLPQITSLHQLNGLPYFILKMPNNYDYYKEERTKLNMDYRSLLEHLKDKDSKYYYDNVLIEMGKTLNDFITEG